MKSSRCFEVDQMIISNLIADNYGKWEEKLGRDLLEEFVGRVLDERQKVLECLENS